MIALATSGAWAGLVWTGAGDGYWNNLNYNALSFEADVGVDSEMEAKKGSVKFKVIADGRVVFESPVMKSGDDPVHVKVDLAGVKNITLIADDAGDGIYKDHADWANAFFVMRSGAVPKSVK